MTLEEYKQRAENDEEWAPGWLVIDEQFKRLYPGVEPLHYGTTLNTRANAGGNEYLDGYSIYASTHGYRHIVTYGMTVLYADEEAFGSEWNGWGYEMTMKLTGDDDESNMSAINLLAFLARDTYTRESFIEPFQTIKFSGRPLFQYSGSAITDILIVPDTEVPGVDTLHGRTDFLQLIGITRKELEAIRQDSNLVETLINALRVDYPYLETDPRRAKCFL